MEDLAATVHKGPWNKGKIVGQKAPLKLKDIRAIRIRFATWQSDTRNGNVRPRFGQQAASL